MKFTQTSIPFTNRYNSVFLNDLESVPYKEKHENPSPHNLHKVFASQGPVPDSGTLLEGILFLGIIMGAGSFISFIAWIANGREVPWLIILCAVGISLYHIVDYVKWRLFVRKLSTAWKNGWIDCYPALIGSLYYDEKNVKADKAKYFYLTTLMVVAPSGETRTIEEFEACARKPRQLIADGVALASERHKIRLDAQRHNGWTFLAVVRGKPIEHGSLETGLARPQVAAGLDRVRYGWPLDNLGPLPDTV
ncbi:hypothetical protein [Corynebacterium sp. HMSC078H07]|uniref:hypothetical protein n=1 Tax=Corynebacterium sp. HMSC078H07 TaxID=1739379 RepID=UPI0008A10A61|nr:hypothetical protein [Corynebacterium sp. HMSC078H07]OFR65914.1 hypothetical protein HMPREF2875_01945 [Corynebacterium sp. HMSC078H07]